MVDRLARIAVRLVMLLLGLMLIAFLAYAIRGSLEEFPTEEDHAKVRTVSGGLASLIILAEAGLWLLLRRLDRSSRPGDGRAR